MQIKGKWLWISQRLTAVILFVQALTVLAIWISASDFNRQDLIAHLQSTGGFVLHLSALIALVVHAAIGVWNINTDYLTAARLGAWAPAIRWSAHLAAGLLLLAILFFGIQILTIASTQTTP
ncbi:MAG: succinate dehydrogenase, hydrophobic membrane anchor protein [Gammaproteobacteria bacterium]